MRACPEYQEMLLMDVLGELTQNQARDLDSHMDRCANCRHERERIAQLIKIVQKHPLGAELDSQEASAVRARVAEVMFSQSHLSWLDLLKTKWKLMVPAVVAAVCLFLISIVSLNTFWPGKHSVEPQVANVSLKQDNEMEDPELIKDMELLEQIDTLRMLVKVVDNKEII